MNNEEKQKSYELAEKLLSEQNFTAAVIGGAVATVLAAAAYGMTVAKWWFSYGFAAAGVGIVIGLTIGFLGRGISMKFSVVATLYTMTGCVLGNMCRAMIELAPPTATSVIDVFRSSSLSGIMERSIYNIFSVALVYWFVAVVAAVFLARRSLSRSQRLALGLLEMRR
jgi:hypothetical protein